MRIFPFTIMSKDMLGLNFASEGHVSLPQDVQEFIPEELNVKPDHVFALTEFREDKVIKLGKTYT